MVEAINEIRFTYNDLKKRQIDYLDRMYTLSSGEESGWSKPLDEARREFIESSFRL